MSPRCRWDGQVICLEYDRSDSGEFPQSETTQLSVYLVCGQLTIQTHALDFFDFSKLSAAGVRISSPYTAENVSGARCASSSVVPLRPGLLV